MRTRNFVSLITFDNTRVLMMEQQCGEKKRNGGMLFLVALVRNRDSFSIQWVPLLHKSSCALVGGSPKATAVSIYVAQSSFRMMLYSSSSQSIYNQASFCCLHGRKITLRW